MRGTFRSFQDLIACGRELNETHARGTLFSCLFFRLFARLPLAYTEAPLSFAFLRQSERELCEILTRETIYISVFLFLLLRRLPLAHISLLAFSMFLPQLASERLKKRP